VSASARAAAWLFVLIVLAFAGSGLAAHAAGTQSFYDAFTHTNYAAAYRLPIHVVQSAAPGFDVVAIVWVTVAAIAFCGTRIVAELGSATRPSARALLICFLVAACAMSAFAIVQSSDIYYYAMYGRLYGVYGVNPYVLNARLVAPGDPVLAQVLPFAGNPPFPDPYGPLWTLTAGLTAKLESHASLLLQAWSFRAQAVVATALCIWGVLHLLRRVPAADRITAAGRYAFHPLVLYETAVGGHNDALMMAPAVWAFAVVDDLPLIAGLLLGVAIAFKYVAIVALPFLAVRSRKNGLAAPAIVTVLAIALPLLCAHPFSSSAGGGGVSSNESHLAVSLVWLAAMPFFAAGTGNVPAFSWLPALPVAGELSWPRLIEFGAFAVVAVIVVYGAVRCLRRFEPRAVWRTIAALLLAMPTMHPWYAEWLMPAAAFGGRWSIYAWWFGVAVFACYLVDGVASQSLAIAVCATLVFVILPIAAARFARPLSISTASESRA
jgi:hypothetical protein